MRNRAFIAALAVVAIAPETRHASSNGKDEIVVIVHPDSPIRKLSAAQLRAVFTTRMLQVDGARVVPFNLPPRDRVRVAFDRAVLNLKPNKVTRFWIDRRIRGGARPPRQIPRTRTVVRVVAKLKSAVGYVPASALTAKDRVRVVARIRKGAVLTSRGTK